MMTMTPKDWPMPPPMDGRRHHQKRTLLLSWFQAEIKKERTEKKEIR
jgi:hypothetical protein